ncbi:MAG TPA: enoyl-CoA hydratase/isomerase family protein [Trebonia sp.]|jgi:enoyl-CoA hydratase/carnithine racemase
MTDTPPSNVRMPGSPTTTPPATDNTATGNPVTESLGAAGLRFERQGPIGWCRIDRPQARNAFTPAMYYGLKRAVHLVNADKDLAALIITGTGDVFSPGGDMGGRSDPGDEPIPVTGQDVLPFLPIRDSRAPVIAAVNGICQAGGMLVAMLADICVASDRATFRAPELLRGIPDATFAAVLPAHCGLAVARDLLLSARRLDATEALRLGVISRVVPHQELERAAVEAAREILQTPPAARTHVKRMLNERYGTIDYQTMFWSLETSTEPREGMRAFLEKRSPNWVPEEFAKTSGSSGSSEVSGAPDR